MLANFLAYGIINNLAKKLIYGIINNFIFGKKIICGRTLGCPPSGGLPVSLHQ